MADKRLKLRDSAYDHIRRRIVSGEFTMGTRISEQAIAAEIGISRTPVRSAIHQLEAEGLLEQIPRYGTIVRKLDRQDLGELYECRIALESYACELAACRIRSGDLSELKALCAGVYDAISRKAAVTDVADPEIVSRSVEADLQFHLIILRSTSNARLMRSAVDSRLFGDWGRYARSQTDIRILERVWRQHEAIQIALESGDGEQARKVMVEHLAFAKEDALMRYQLAVADAHAHEIMHRMTGDQTHQDVRLRATD